MQEEEKEVGQVNDVNLGGEVSTVVNKDPAHLEITDTPEIQALNTEVLDILPSTEVEGETRE